MTTKRDLSANASLVGQLIEHVEEFGLVLLDGSGSFTSWNPGIEHILGYPKQEWIGRSLNSVFLSFGDAGGTCADELAKASREGKTAGSRWILHQDGSQVLARYSLLSLSMADAEDAAFGFVVQEFGRGGTGSDILKTLPDALEQSTVLVRTFDGVITHWTGGCEALYGYDRKAAVGQICQEFLKTRMPVSFAEVNRALLDSGSWAGEVEHVRQDGRHLNVSTIWALVRDESGNPTNVIETNTDITARISAQRELEIANEQLRRMAIELERSNEELQEFARIASHDLSAPITSARWLVDLLTMRHRASLNEEGQKCLAQVGQSLSRMSDLVDGVLKHAQVGTSSVATSAATPLSDSVNSALEDLGRQIDLSGAKIACDSLPSVQVEPNALNQLFQNLISNAIKYRGSDAPAIHISARWERPWWVISVRDNGVGIDPAWHERIFHPMQRVHGGEVSGSGIGLATCRKIVTRVGGRIWVESHPGKGSTFSFTLPGPESSGHAG